jgi:hypothetical protein
VVVTDTLIPDLEISLELNAFAPRLARHRLEEVGHLAPDVRDAVSLLTSELVTRAVRACPQDSCPEALLDQVADRWSIDGGEHTVCMWFEIDRG